MKNFWQRICVFLLWHYRAFIRVGIGIVCCLFILASTWQCWVIPHINEYKGWVTDKLETALGRPVQIGKLQAGWRGFKPYLRFSDFILYNQVTVPAFHLQRLEARLSWWHLLVGKVNFSHVRLVKPNITIRRDKHAMWWVGGIPLISSTTAGNNQWLNWLWQQTDIHIEQGLLHWEDDTEQTKSVTLKQVNMHLSRLLSRHRIQINFLAPQSVFTSPLTIEAIIYGENIDAFSRWRGEILLADVQGNFAQLWPYLPSAIRPFELIQAAGRITALRLVFDTLTTWQLSFQTQLTNIEALFDEKLAPLKIAQFQGRVKLDYDPTHEKISLEKFSIQPPSLHSEKWANFFYEKNKGGYRVKAQHIFLQSMWKALPSLPQLAYVTRHAAHLTGFIKHVDLQWPKQTRDFEQVKGVVDIENVAIRTPTLDLRNLNLQLHLQGTTGKAHLSGKSLYIDYPQQFVAPLSLRSTQVTTGWQKLNNGWEINIRHLAASNAEMALQLNGRYYYTQNNEDSMILQGKVTRANANRIYTYLPRILGDDVLLWLKKALYAGEAKDTTIQVAGKLKHFPFANGEPGKFDIAGRINNVAMAYAENWPAITGITGRLHFTKRGMTIYADNAQTSQVKLSHIVARIPDMKYDEKIFINGQAVGKTAYFLQFLKHSPLQELLTGGEHLQTQGDGALALNLAIPLAMPQQAQVQGAFQFQENQLDFGKNIPTLRAVQGKLTFTEKGLVLKNMQANALGGDINLQGQTNAEGLTLDIVGRANMAQVAKYYIPGLPPVLKGNTNYRAQLKLAGNHYTFDLSSALKGVTLALPAPLTKAANDSSPLTLHIHDRAGDSQLAFNYGNQVAGDIAWRGKDMSAIEGEIILNPARENNPKRRNGLWLTGQIEQINGHEWQPFFTSTPIAENRYLQGIDMHIAQLTGYGYQLKGIDLLAQRQTNGWSGEVVADNVAGHFSLHTADKRRIQLNLSKLYWPWQPFPNQAIKDTEKFDERMLQGKNFPILQANITDLRYQGQKLGQLYAHVTPAPQAWQLNRLRLINEDGELGMKGHWDYRSHDPMTEVEIQIDSQHAENFLHRFGQTQVMKGGNAIINTHLQWQDSPFAIDYASMAGEVQVRAQKGQFAQVDPGAGRLLGMLSLQALPRRMSLDFSDIFSSGLVFDIVEGRSVIKKGVAYLDHLVINGPAAQIRFHGNMDIVHQQQNLTVKIIPVVGDGVSIAAGVLVNPLIGVGAFIVQRLLKDPVGQLAAYQYTITGTWQDPIITKLNGPTQQQHDGIGGE